ncbi:hypothetical protein WI88_26750 [Burkholderia ubonensis]|nr:hypothetical protein WI88_26750 [Burkholderia ubonensis]
MIVTYQNYGARLIRRCIFHVMPRKFLTPAMHDAGVGAVAAIRICKIYANSFSETFFYDISKLYGIIIL